LRTVSRSLALSTVFEHSVARRIALQAAAVCGFAGLTAVSAHVRIPLPFSPVPITLQTLTVVLAGLILGAGGGVASQALYIGLGAVGLPVFAGGAAAMFGPTGGYIVGFVIAATIAGAIGRRVTGTAGTAAAFATGTFIIHACGVVWLWALTHQAVGHCIAVGALPFVPGEALKLVAAIGLVRVMRPAWERIREGR